MLSPSFHNWAKWIGRNTRGSNLIRDTEYRNAQQVQNSYYSSEFSITEDHLTDEILKLKVFMCWLSAIYRGWMTIKLVTIPCDIADECSAKSV